MRPQARAQVGERAEAAETIGNDLRRENHDVRLIGDTACLVLEPVRRDDAGHLVHQRHATDTGALERGHEAAGHRGVADRRAGAGGAQPIGQGHGTRSLGILAGQAVHNAMVRELRSKLALPEQHDVDVAAQILGESPGQVKCQELGSVRMRVVRDDEHTRPLACVSRDQRVARGLQPRVAVAPIRLEMRAFGPLVPGVHEDQALIAVAEARDRVNDRVLQPGAVAIGIRAPEDGRRAPGGAPRCPTTA